MTIYHLSVKPVQRSKGRSSVAAAAYRAGCEIYDERTGLTHNYTKKMGVEYTEIIVPFGVNAPSRSELWNMAEKAENRKDGCTAREYEINLPYQLSDQQRIELAQDFSNKLAEIHGIAVDLCLHKPTPKEIENGSDPRNYHAHILTTTRKITNNGLTDKADIEKAGRKRKEDLLATRKLWADVANEHLKRAGLDEQIDHRSLKEQGKKELPTIKLGKTASTMERQGEYTRKGEINTLIKNYNNMLRLSAVFKVDTEEVEERRNELAATFISVNNDNYDKRQLQIISDWADANQLTRDSCKDERAYQRAVLEFFKNGSLKDNSGVVGVLLYPDAERQHFEEHHMKEIEPLSVVQSAAQPPRPPRPPSPPTPPRPPRPR
ncbi:MobQ family relaxase [Psychrobacter sp. AOP5-GZ1-6]|uniref:MobQ family relaxase n=1 Tax=Psychrobacter sp. AOP5-GZ1-6 TaxID=3457649 RepID=UPI00402B6538